MKIKEYLTENFETEFEQADTITALQELLKRMKMQRTKWMARGLPASSAQSLPLLDEQMGLVEWELKKLRDAQSRGRFRAYYAFMKMLDEHYPFKTPLIRYKYILDDGVTGLKKEILSNMLHLSPFERMPYLVRIKYEMTALLENVYAQDSASEEWCRKYNTTERDLFSTEASKHRNGVYRILSEGDAGTEVADEDVYEMQNDLYNVFYGRAVRSISGFVDVQTEEYGKSAVAVQEIPHPEKLTTGGKGFWNGLPMDKVVEHFRPLTERKSRNGMPFLTDEQLAVFIAKAFLGKDELPKGRINFSTGEKGFVIERFYAFYNLAVTQYNEKAKKEKYIRLLSDHFDNWEYKSIVPFFKPNKVKSKW